MKNIQFLIVLMVLFSACSKKTYRSNSNTLSHQIKNAIDTSAYKTSLITDKTVTLVNRLIDTNVTVSGKMLIGALPPAKRGDKDTSARFENEDLSLLLHIDGAGKATATAIPKLKTVKVKALEQKAIFNNVIKAAESDINVKRNLNIKTNLAEKLSEKQTSGTQSNFSLIIILLFACIFVWLLGRLGLLKML